MSPAASTARPEVAITLAWTMRSIPAMPMADMQAADGGRDQAHQQRHQDRERHRRAAAGVGDRVVRERLPASNGHHQEHQGQRGQQDVEGDLVGGALPRRAPSTIAIMRSRNELPGRGGDAHVSARSDSTRVPPVTAELRSPPLSRTTGALSPVIALSSTLATPCTTSPSPGTCLPGLDTAPASPAVNCDDEHLAWSAPRS
jgi:hypothetical protein